MKAELFIQEIENLKKDIFNKKSNINAIKKICFDNYFKISIESKIYSKISLEEKISILLKKELLSHIENEEFAIYLMEKKLNILLNKEI
jgi:sulfatase maturation enzyme AslB (radical SAM superfamily)